MALEMQNFEALSPPFVKKITRWTLVQSFIGNLLYHFLYTFENSGVQYSLFEKRSVQCNSANACTQSLQNLKDPFLERL